MVYKGDEFMKGDKAFNTKDESPLLYGQRTRRQCEARKHRKRESTVVSITDLKHATSSAASKHQPPLKDIESPRESSATWKDLNDGHHFVMKSREVIDGHDLQLSKNKTKGGLEGPGSRRLSFGPSAIDMRQGDFKRMPSLPIQQKQVVSGTKTASDDLKPPTSTSGKTATIGAAKPNPHAAYNEIQEYLTLYYIRSRPDMDARNLIFGKDASVQNLYFDASGHSRANDIVTLIDRMSTGGFMGTQSYVCIPSLDLDQDSTSLKKPEVKSYGAHALENPKLGRADLVRVFDKLASYGVTRILSLQVDDLKEPSHTDSAIELALQGRESFQSRDREPAPSQNGVSAESSHQKRRAILVETWDWRKPDLSPDVIAFAAPHVEQVNLYWSGNQTVLRGWGSDAGIPRLTQLRKIRLHAAPGLESIAKMHKMIDLFINDITSRTSLKKEDVKVILRLKGLAAHQTANEQQGDVTSGAAHTESRANQQHKWLETMDKFRSSLVLIHGVLNDMKINMQPSRIKVALIDDGIDYTRLHTYNNIVTAVGLSYYPRIGGSEMPWHRSDGHGTIMANMIARVNPWVSLEVFRVHNKRLRDGHRTIFAESAAKAIMGAIRRQVQVISISWTVDGKSTREHSDAIRQLEKAIDEAVKNNILIFCSASDEYGTNAKDTLPYKSAPTSMFRIGAALRYGQSAPDIEDKEKIDYFLPGMQVFEDSDPRESVLPKAHDGSSISTALAAGLASLIMYCAAVMREYYTKATQEGGTSAAKEFTEFVAALQSRHNMKQAFDNIGINKAEDKYLEVWNRFESATKNIMDLAKKSNGRQEDRVKMMEELRDLVRKLCHDVR
ncbi:hypothetical protein F4808DRAFT_434753 [Astrocystis sublimbata]|nr:hypothetical protein F4808DRAFT_434753 [Astrocystis sublimbata]